ncbi:MAG TPA: isoleucine--tRNA ligase [Candidatus Pristimantibacillus sp.]|jgi:isoleucyl-tRNA synthetase|nr:isoleucine--tRNA ligase [Candidatus Pristimantibacillus sp.]
MKFQKGTRRKAIEYEKDLVLQWKHNRTFEKSVEMRPKDNGYVFYDGPPFITGVPHHGTLLSSIAKDVVPRYWTMKGKRVERVWGWDCHGLPAEVFTEKKLGIHDKRDIGTKISLEEYITTCRENMSTTGSLWEDTIDRIGRWVDFKGAYKTMDKEYMESVWWAFKQLYEKGKIYEGEKVLLYCTRDATPISKAEVAMDNSYQDVTDPSVYVKFKLKGEDVSLLAWTTTPWTLPANTATAVNQSETYAEVEIDGQRLILAKGLLDKVLTNEKHQVLPYTLVRTLKGKELVGKEYEPLFEDRGKNAHRVWHADYVSLEEGTGIVHLAPAYGEEDYVLAKQKDFPIVSNIDDNGLYKSGEWKGQNVWESNKQIAKELHERGIVWKIQYVTHSYPHCHRCHTRLMYRAHPSWFMDIDGQRQQMLEENGNINWFPAHLKNGRFAKTVESAPDWNLSRDRFWATAMPVWKGKDDNGKEHIKIVGSYAELKELSGRELEDYHRPWIDDVTFTIDGIHYKRIDRVLDCWFESGSMSFAQFHYPFENVEKFEENFPGDFIVEYVGQVRAWFYYMHAVSVALFGKNSFKNVITTGTLAGSDGRKMSKSLGNYTDPNELMDRYSADALRFLLMSSPLMSGEDFNLLDKDVADVARKLSMVWNMYDFFTLYAEVDGWEWDGNYDDPVESLTNPLDVWIVSRVHQLTAEIEKHMDGYDIPNAMKPILPFLDDASNWYVRRSRRRFWKSEDDGDKQAAYRTLHYVLVRLAHIMAPFTPFLAEELYQKLTGGESVHLRDWPATGHVNELILDRMAFVREVINEGLSQRAANSLKVRQPLQSVAVAGADDQLGEDATEFVPVILEELNVKELSSKTPAEGRVALDLRVTPELKREGMMREVVRNVQSARKQAGLNVDDRIELSLSTTDPELHKAIREHGDTIKAETLATSLAQDQTYAFDVSCSVDDAPLTISIEKAA